MKNIIITLLILISSIAVASDLEREKRIGDQIFDAILDGDPIYLTDSLNHSFLSIYMPSESGETKGGAIIMHGRGMHPDWKDVTQPLRTQLPQYGWQTLSIQMPVLAKTAKYYDYVDILEEAGPRIEAAIHFLASKGINNIILIAHSCSIHMSIKWLAKNNSDNISGFIGIGMGATDYKQPMKQALPLDKLKIPVLDIFGSDDYTAVKKMADKRLIMLKQANILKSDQIIILDSDHNHKNNSEQLINAIILWMNKLKD